MPSPPSQPHLLPTLQTAFPVTLQMLSYRAPWLTSLAFLGHRYPTSLASCALASTLANVTGLSLVVGLSSGMATLAAQAHGRRGKGGGGGDTDLRRTLGAGEGGRRGVWGKGSD